MDCSPPGSSVHEIFQARIMEWVAFPSLGDLPNPEIEPRSPALQVDSLPSEPPGKSPPRIGHALLPETTVDISDSEMKQPIAQALHTAPYMQATPMAGTVFQRPAMKHHATHHDPSSPVKINPPLPVTQPLLKQHTQLPVFQSVLLIE